MIPHIFLVDIGRILNGNTPPVFYIEIIIRAVFVYVLIIAGLRFMGKRMASRLSRNEVAAMASLAAATGMPIQTPDKGLLPALVMALVVILAQRIIATISTRRQTFERLTQGAIGTLVLDSCLQVDEMQKSRISRARLFSQLRGSSIRHLGEVKRLYLEAGGSFTLIRNNEHKPGPSVLPDWDQEFTDEQKRAPEVIVCSHCGCHVAPAVKECPNCHRQYFEPAIH